MTTLAELAAEVAPLGPEAIERVGFGAAPARGSLREIAQWIASVQAETTAHAPHRVRVVRFGFDADAGPPAAGEGEVRNVPTPEGDVAAAVNAGVAAADDEIDRGADLVVVVTAHAGVAAEVITSVLTDAEPVRVLPRGAAMPPQEWMARAELVRDARRRAMPARHAVDELLAATGDRDLLAATAFLLRAVGRRTPVLLDGFGALAAALAAYELQTRSARWMRVAGGSGSPAEELALARLGQRPLLDLGIDVEDGTAGLLAAIVVRFAIDSANPGAV